MVGAVDSLVRHLLPSLPSLLPHPLHTVAAGEVGSISWLYCYAPKLMEIVSLCVLGPSQTLTGGLTLTLKIQRVLTLWISSSQISHTTGLQGSWWFLLL